MATKGPLRKVVEREQDFHSTDDYPDGWIVETLECGHIRVEPVHDGIQPFIAGDRKRIVKGLPGRRRCQACLQQEQERLRQLIMSRK